MGRAQPRRRRPRLSPPRWGDWRIEPSADTRFRPTTTPLKFPLSLRERVGVRGTSVQLREKKQLVGFIWLERTMVKELWQWDWLED
jgi:hypothetical protein